MACLRRLGGAVGIDVDRVAANPLVAVFVDDGPDLGSVTVGNGTIVGDEEQHVRLVGPDLQGLLSLPLDVLEGLRCDGRQRRVFWRGTNQVGLGVSALAPGCQQLQRELVAAQDGLSHGRPDGCLEGLAQLGIVFFLGGRQPESDRAHLIRAPFSPLDVDRRRLRVARVAGRVVPDNLDVQHRAPRQTDAVLVEKNVLPVEVPVLDPEQVPGLPVRQLRLHLERLAQEMGVRKDADQVHVHGEGERVAESHVGLAGRQVNPGKQSEGRRHARRQQGPARLPVGQVDADGQPALLRLPRGVEVDLEDQVRVLIQSIGQVAGQFLRHASDGPGSQRAGGAEAETGETGPARLALLRRQLAGPAAVVQVEEHVMHHGRSRAPELDRLDPFVLLQVQGQDNVLVQVRPSLGHLEVGVHGHDQVGLAQLPASRVLRQFRQFLRIALRHAGAGPLLEQANLPIGQSSRALELAEAGLGLPGRHVAAADGPQDGAGVLADVLVAQQRKRSRFPGVDDSKSQCVKTIGAMCSEKVTESGRAAGGASLARVGVVTQARPFRARTTPRT